MSHDLPPNFDPHVRDALRGLFAAPRRVRQMHDELLAHLLASYEEELTRPGATPTAAAASAARRLGDPADLRLQLQSSVPLPERLLFQIVSRKENPMSRWIWLLAVCAFLFGMSMVLPALAQIKQGVLHSTPGVPWNPVGILLFATGLLITLAGLGTILYGVVHRLRRRPA
jgi:hypothetical protein